MTAVVARQEPVRQPSAGATRSQVRFAEAMYRVAFASSVMDRIDYQHPEPAGGPHESH
jgi:hypothetical protein